MHQRAKTAMTVGLVTAPMVSACASASGASGKPGPPPKAHQAAQCSSSDTAPRNPANPLDTAAFTGTDPLAGAHLFVESPWQ